MENQVQTNIGAQPQSGIPETLYMIYFRSLTSLEMRSCPQAQNKITNKLEFFETPKLPVPLTDNDGKEVILSQNRAHDKRSPEKTQDFCSKPLTIHCTNLHDRHKGITP